MLYYNQNSKGLEVPVRRAGIHECNGYPRQVACSRREASMAKAKDIDVKGYCDTLYSELSGIKKGIVGLKAKLEKTYGAESEMFRTHGQHLFELTNFVDWKLQILMKACPYDWKGLGDEVESTVSVRAPENVEEIDVSGGYIGG